MVAASMSDVLGRVVPGGEQGVKGYVYNTVLAADNNTTPIPATMAFRFRPTTINETISAEFDEQAAIGMSHPYQTFRSTTAVSYQFEIYWNALMILKEIGKERIENHPERRGDELAVIGYMIEEERRWLEALTLPPLMNDGLVGASPPLCLLVIPGIVTTQCRLRNISFVFESCDLRGNIKELRAMTVWVEALNNRTTMQDQLLNGSFRNG